MHLSHSHLQENVFISTGEKKKKKERKLGWKLCQLVGLGKLQSPADYFESSGSPERGETTEVVKEA